MVPNPRIMRALVKSELTGNDHLPVDSLNSNLIQVDDLPLLPNPKKRKLIDFKGKRRVSYQLRFLYLALEQWTEKQAGCEIVFATVHFSVKQEERLKRAKKGPAGAFSDQLKKALMSLTTPYSYFLVLEQGTSVNKRLHAHIVISCYPDEAANLHGILKRYTTGGPSGVDIRDHYELKFRAKHGSFEHSAMEMDLEYDDCSYTESSKKPGEFIRKVPVNIGVADYLSKQLESSERLFKGTPFYAPQNLRRLANEIYGSAYEHQKALNAAGNICG